jgi:hypothetical protein
MNPDRLPLFCDTALAKRIECVEAAGGGGELSPLGSPRAGVGDRWHSQNLDSAAVVVRHRLARRTARTGAQRLAPREKRNVGAKGGNCRKCRLGREAALCMDSGTPSRDRLLRVPTFCVPRSFDSGNGNDTASTCEVEKSI